MMRRHTSFPAVRQAMMPTNRQLSDAQIAHVLIDSFPGAAPEDVENFMKSLTQVVKVAAPIAQKALPGMISGAVQGAAVAGPYGAIAGAVAGGAISALSQPKAAPAPAVAARPAQPPRPVPPRRPAAAPVRAPTRPIVVSNTELNATQAQAAQQLLALLSRPETIQALQALAMGINGRSRVGRGARSVPTRSVAEAIAEVSHLAAGLSVQPEQSDRMDEEAYLRTPTGRLRAFRGSATPTATLVMSDFMASRHRTRSRPTPTHKRAHR